MLERTLLDTFRATRMSTTQEFYIRSENDTDARGPFTQDQLSSLVEAQQVDGSTLYYDAAALSVEPQSGAPRPTAWRKAVVHELVEDA